MNFNNMQIHIQNWAHRKDPITKVTAACDQLTKISNNDTLVILAPSYLMHKINYQKIINNPKVDTMTVNNGYLMPGTEKCDYYLPFTTINKTRNMLGKPDYIKWLKNYKGLVMHGLHYNDGTNSYAPYVLAKPDEVQDTIKTCPNTKFSIWHHSWGDWAKSQGGVPGMLKFPFYDKWTPRRIPWGHCGAISGFAIPLAMTLGYKKIFIVAMGWRYVINGYHNPNGIKDQSKVATDSWLSVSKIRFPNQAKLAEKHGIILKVGPENLIEPELKNFFKTFKSIDNI